MAVYNIVAKELRDIVLHPTLWTLTETTRRAFIVALLGILKKSDCDGHVETGVLKNVIRTLLGLVSESKGYKVMDVASQFCIKAHDDDCAICFEEMILPLQSPCNHIYCKDCIYQWMEKNATCPECRNPTTPATLKLPNFTPLSVSTESKKRKREQGEEECDSRSCRHNIIHIAGDMLGGKLPKKVVLYVRNTQITPYTNGLEDCNLSVVKPISNDVLGEERALKALSTQDTMTVLILPSSSKHRGVKIPPSLTVVIAADYYRKEGEGLERVNVRRYVKTGTLQDFMFSNHSGVAGLLPTSKHGFLEFCYHLEIHNFQMDLNGQVIKATMFQKAHSQVKGKLGHSNFSVQVRKMPKSTNGNHSTYLKYFLGLPGSNGAVLGELKIDRRKNIGTWVSSLDVVEYELNLPEITME
jgi:hypothetical protein